MFLDLPQGIPFNLIDGLVQRNVFYCNEYLVEVTQPEAKIKALASTEVLRTCHMCQALTSSKHSSIHQNFDELLA